MSETWYPPNGTSMLDWMTGWCDLCERDRKWQEAEGNPDPADSCPYLRDSMIYKIGEDGYPNKEWIWKDKEPICTKFIEIRKPERRCRIRDRGYV